MPKLTKRVIDTLRPSSGLREIFAWDSELRGFGVRIMPSGIGSYIVKYRNREGRQRKLALGRVGSLTPDEARALARQHFARVAGGADPSAERRAIREAITVAELCDLYLEDAAGRVKPSTLAMDRSRIEVHVKPLIGSRGVAALTGEDLERLQNDIVAGRSAKPRREQGRGGVARGGKGAASRTLGMLGTVLEFARRKKIIVTNPSREVEKLPDGRQTRFLAIDEIARLGAALRSLEAGGASPAGLAAIRFLLLSGCRRMEALALPLAWVDWGARCIRFQDSKGIRAREMGSRTDLRPLGGAALAVLQAVPRQVGTPWAFPATRGEGHFVGLPKLLKRARATASLDDETITVHVLRHSFGATAAGMGYSELTIAGLLGHRVAGVTARYAHVPDAALLAAADSVATRIAEALG
jgi:integrase